MVELTNAAALLWRDLKARGFGYLERLEQLEDLSTGPSRTVAAAAIEAMAIYASPELLAREIEVRALAALRAFVDEPDHVREIEVRVHGDRWGVIAPSVSAVVLHCRGCGELFSPLSTRAGAVYCRACFTNAGVSCKAGEPCGAHTGGRPVAAFAALPGRVPMPRAVLDELAKGVRR